MRTQDARLDVTRAVLWLLVGLAGGMVVARRLAGLPPTDPPAVPAWIALSLVPAALVLGFEAASGRSWPGPRSATLALAAGAVLLSGKPIAPLLVGLGPWLGAASAVALLTLALLFRAEATTAGTGPLHAAAALGKGPLLALALVAGAVLGVGVSELASRSSLRSAARPVEAPRHVTARAVVGSEPGLDLSKDAGGMADPAAEGRPALLLAAGAKRVVLFDHAAHQERAGGDASCGACHHRNRPFDRATSCSSCHRDASGVTDTFGHEAHVRALGGNGSCAACHPSGRGLSRTEAASCDAPACHGGDTSTEPLVRRTADLPAGMAVSYADALHGLCGGCHEIERQALEVRRPEPEGCGVCHRYERVGPRKFAHAS